MKITNAAAQLPVNNSKKKYKINVLLLDEKGYFGRAALLRHKQKTLGITGDFVEISEAELLELGLFDRTELFTEVD